MHGPTTGLDFVRRDRTFKRSRYYFVMTRVAKSTHFGWSCVFLRQNAINIHS